VERDYGSANNANSEHATMMNGFRKTRMKHAGLFCSLLLAATTSVALTQAWGQSLPGTKRDLDFDAHMKTVDLDDPKMRLEYKLASAGGSSIGMFIGVGDAPTDRSFVPTNPSSIPEAEVVAYRLSRFLGVSRLTYPVDYYQLGTKATAQFKAMVTATPENTDKDRAYNRNLVLTELKRNPSVLGIYRIRPKTKMYTASVLGTDGEFNMKLWLAREIQASGPMPGEKQISLDGIKGGQKGFPEVPTERRVELARQLSTIFVLDQLFGQWDRFWNNLEASGDKNGRLKLIARDNGGATLENWDTRDDYNRWYSRFDRDLIDRLTALNAFLKGKSSEFSGYTDVEAWKKAVGFISAPSYEVFQMKLSRLIESRVPSLVKRYGEQTFFPPKTAEVAQLDAADTGEDD
jgi:hypothetical protein